MIPSLRLPTRTTSVARPWRHLLLAVTTGLALVASNAAHAVAQCVPQASGVPALGGAPNFIDSAAGEPNYWPRLDDPRWRGALVRGFGSGASETAVFKTLRTTGADAALYLSWYVKVDPSLDPNIDLLRVGISPGAAADVRLFEIVPFTNAAASKNAEVPPGHQTRDIQGGVWTNVTSPAWLTGNTRVWLDVPNQQWAINMRVPISAVPANGLNLPAEFKLAFELEVFDGMNMVFYRFDNAVALDDLSQAPNFASWTDFNIALAPGDAGCVKSISIATSDVGTTNVDAAMNPRPNRIKLSGSNTFFALPNNESGNDVAAGAISGTFRVANWGTQPNWNDIPDPTTSLWKQINSAPVSNAGIIGNNNKASLAGGNALSFPWTPTASERCLFTGQAGIPAAQSPDGNAIPGDPSCPNVNPLRRLHQCMLVELSGAGLTFNPASVYRNMDFVDASTFEREAEVSVAGLAPGSEPQRDVYLYVQKLMMPKNIGTPQAPLALVDYAKVDAILQQGDDDGEGDGDGDGQVVPGIAGPINADKPQPGAVATPSEPKPAPRPPLDGDFEVLNQQFPTYVVHAFHDTGETVTINGQSRRVLRPQSSFGYYVHHEGALTGWDTELQNAQQVAPNYYKLAVPEGGSKTVVTKIVARESDQPPSWFDKLPWWIWLLMILLVLLIALLLRRKPSGP